jgi:hypothetical protein
MLIIPVTLEVEVGGSRFGASLGKGERSYLKKKPKAKRLGVWLK